MINQFIIAGITFATWSGGVAYFAYQSGSDSQIAKQAETQELIATVKAEAAMGAASAISGIQVNHTTINNRLQKEIATNTVYADCKHTDAGLRELNNALENRGRPTGGGDVPVKTDETRK